MKKLLTALTIVACTTSVPAFASTPVMFSTFGGFNAPNSESVAGVRLALFHGVTNEISGVDISVLGLSVTEKTAGVNVGFFGIANVTQDMKGLSLGLVNWMQGNAAGANIGAINVTNNVKGANISAINYSTGNTMVDIGAVSISKRSTVQVGFVNITEKIEGVQLGLFNCAENGFLKCFPIINWAK
jgi:hypothetical protein